MDTFKSSIMFLCLTILSVQLSYGITKAELISGVMEKYATHDNLVPKIVPAPKLQTVGSGHNDSSEYSILASRYGEQFVSSDNCGGYMEGPAGGINYKVYETLAQSELCIWTIMVPHKSTIQVRLVQEGFYSNFQQLYIFNSTNPTRYQFQQPGIILNANQYGDQYKANNITGGSLIRIHFSHHYYSGASPSPTGFSLIFEGVGIDQDISDWKVPILKVFETEGLPSGSISYRVNSTSPAAAEGEFVYATILPEPGKQIALTLNSLVAGYSGCYWNLSYWYDTIRITELESFTILFQACRTTNINTTIYSPYPLSISMYSFTSSGNRFEISWNMV